MRLKISKLENWDAIEKMKYKATSWENRNEIDKSLVRLIKIKKKRHISPVSGMKQIIPLQTL